MGVGVEAARWRQLRGLAAWVSCVWVSWLRLDGPRRGGPARVQGVRQGTWIHGGARRLHTAEHMFAVDPVRYRVTVCGLSQGAAPAMRPCIGL